MLPPTFLIVPMQEAHGRQICQWRYAEPYQLYHFRPWEEMAAEQEQFTDPDIRTAQFHAVLGSDNSLCGFAQFFPMVGVTRLGLGMHPDLCGRGLGPVFVQTIALQAHRLHPEHDIDLEVLTWNTRAIRAYERAGFVITDTYTHPTPEKEQQFHCMVWTFSL